MSDRKSNKPPNHDEVAGGQPVQSHTKLNLKNRSSLQVDRAYRFKIQHVKLALSELHHLNCENEL